MEKMNYRFVYNRKKKLNSEGKSLIQIEVYQNRQRIYFSTRLYVSPNQWNCRKRKICNHPHEEDLNAMLYEQIVKLEEIEIALWKKGQKVNLFMIKESLQQKQHQSFYRLMEDEIEKGQMEESTRRNRLTTLLLLKRFQEKLSINELNPAFIARFESYLVANGYHTNTIAKHLSQLRIYINLAIRKGYLREQDNPFLHYIIRCTTSKHSHLSVGELEAIEKWQLPLKRHKWQKELDAFLFCCYTGLRFSDFIRLSSENFREEEGIVWLNFTSQKTGTLVNVPTSLLFQGKALRLLRKYQDELNSFFHLSSNSSVDKRLKRMMQMAGISTPVSFHSARHTHATLLLSQGVNATTIQKLLGHKSLRTTMTYCEVMKQTIVNDLKQAGKRNRVSQGYHK